MTHLLKYLLVFSAILFFSGCEKDSAPTMITEIHNVGSWQPGGTYFYKNIYINEITAEVISSGAVLVYLKDTNSNGYWQLPFTMYPSVEYSRSYDFFVFEGTVQVRVQDSELSVFNPDDAQFKVVVFANNDE